MFVTSEDLRVELPAGRAPQVPDRGRCTPQIARLKLLAVVTQNAGATAARFAVEQFPPSGRRDLLFVCSTGALTPMVGLDIDGGSERELRAAVDSLRLDPAPA